MLSKSQTRASLAAGNTRHLAFGLRWVSWFHQYFATNTLWWTNIAMENGHLQWIFLLKMVIFHCYVSSPEGTVLKQLWVVQMEGRWWYTMIHHWWQAVLRFILRSMLGGRGQLVSYVKSFKWGVWQSSNITSRRKTTTINPDLPKDFTGRPKCLSFIGAEFRNLKLAAATTSPLFYTILLWKDNK